MTIKVTSINYLHINMKPFANSGQYLKGTYKKSGEQILTGHVVTGHREWLSADRGEI